MGVHLGLGGNMRASTFAQLSGCPLGCFFFLLHIIAWSDDSKGGGLLSEDSDIGTARVILAAIDLRFRSQFLMVETCNKCS